MRTFAVRAQNTIVGFSPVRALIGTGVTEAWPRRARAGLRLVAPDDPACALDEEEGSRAGPGRAAHAEWLVRSLGAVGRAWLDQVGPCRVDVIAADLLDDGSRLFFATLADVAGGRVTVRCRAEPSAGQAALAPVTSARERRIEHLAGASGRLDGEELDFLYGQALRYLRAGDGWTAERLLRAVLLRRPTPAVRLTLRTAHELVGRPLEARRYPERSGPDRQPERARGPLRLHAGWERLEEWSDTAGQIERNAVHKALFAVADRTVFRSYETYDDPAEPLSLFVRVRPTLVLKIRIRDLDSFDIDYVGINSGSHTGG
ncbi:DUF6235 family protein [Streptomyces sp. RerS4]|uniref:DUF6235 family protein n=1 Tax=Streptomyces sp. RerS4 TaxID=2942449 RepID=UPI00201BEC23|nr:DUF6235 family protein [Streptomyces sp. RerS4]UQX00009.1 DUF6235 family protein [Streptomyces sp. RerS4]